MYFYELHEGDNDVFADLILVHYEEFSPDEFYELVQAARLHVKDSFEQDTLIEAIAEELERDHGFTFVSDQKLAASVNVSANDDENHLVGVGDDEDDRDDDGEEDGDFRTIIAELRPDAGSRN